MAAPLAAASFLAPTTNAFALGTGAAAGATGAAGGLAGLGAALGGPIGWAGLGLTALGTAGQLFGGSRAASAAREQMEKDREGFVGGQLFAQQFPRRLDREDLKYELALRNSPAYKQARGFEGRMDTFDKMAGKYGPAMARLTSGSFYG